MDERTCSVPSCHKAPTRRKMCERHYRRFMKHGDPLGGPPTFATAEDRFWSKVDKRGPGECWPWLGRKDPDGYGVFSVSHSQTVRAHRYAYMVLVGPIPDDLPLDHVRARGCTRRDCVNALRHLEPVTVHENTMRGDGPSAMNARKSQCKRGHEFTEENTYMFGNGRRSCRACMKEHQRNWYLTNVVPRRARESATQP